MVKSFTSKQIAKMVNGNLTGDEHIEIEHLGPPMLANEKMLAVAFEEEHLKALSNTKAPCVLVPDGMKCEGKTCIEVQRPKMAMGILLNAFYEPPEAPEGIHPTAIIAPTAKLGNNVSIGPYVVIGNNVTIGDNCRILSHVNIGQKAEIGNDCLFYPGVYIGDRVIIKNQVIIHSGTRIGADGYSFVTQEASNIETARESGELGTSLQQNIIKIPSIGSVIIEDDVEIGANTTIDRGTIQNTVIGKNTKIDNLVQIAHNVIIGESCFIVGQVGISGSSIIGNRVVLAGQVGIADHLIIGDDVIILAKSGVSKNISSKTVYTGIPAISRKDFIRNQLNIKSIIDVKKRLNEIEKALQEKEIITS
jgi:UDP-3-O-[3-hydroxymyristoyl] glucosamine N-acyltransferase